LSKEDGDSVVNMLIRHDANGR